MKPSRELDALVAEQVMGWRRQDTPASGGHLWITPDKAAYMPGELPHYSTDIAVAWEVVEQIRHKKPAGWSLTGDLYLHSERDQWRVLYRYDDGFQEFSHAPTAPHAICLAALKAVGG